MRLPCFLYILFFPDYQKHINFYLLSVHVFSAALLQVKHRLLRFNFRSQFFLRRQIKLILGCKQLLIAVKYRIPCSTLLFIDFHAYNFNLSYLKSQCCYFPCYVPHKYSHLLLSSLLLKPENAPHSLFFRTSAGEIRSSLQVSILFTAKQPAITPRKITA